MNQENSMQAWPAGMPDRRRSLRLEPPYITDEGFVVVDRRGDDTSRYPSVPAGTPGGDEPAVRPAA